MTIHDREHAMRLRRSQAGTSYGSENATPKLFRNASPLEPKWLRGKYNEDPPTNNPETSTVEVLLGNGIP